MCSKKLDYGTVEFGGMRWIYCVYSLLVLSDCLPPSIQSSLRDSIAVSRPREPIVDSDFFQLLGLVTHSSRSSWRSEDVWIPLDSFRSMRPRENSVFGLTKKPQPILHNVGSAGAFVVADWLLMILLDSVDFDRLISVVTSDRVRLFFLENLWQRKRNKHWRNWKKNWESFGWIFNCWGVYEWSFFCTIPRHENEKVPGEYLAKKKWKYLWRHKLTSRRTAWVLVFVCQHNDRLFSFTWCIIFMFHHDPWCLSMMEIT